MAGNFLDEFLDGWHTNRAADHENVAKIVVVEFGIRHGFFHWRLASFKKVLGQILEFGAAELSFPADRTVASHADERKGDSSLK